MTTFQTPTFATPTFATPTMTAPTAAPAAPVVETVVSAPTAAVAAPVKEKKERGPRSTTPITKELIEYTRTHIKENSPAEIAAKFGCTKSQVNSALQSIKSMLRAEAITRSGGQAAYAPAGEGKAGKARFDYSQPLTDAAKKVEAYIEQNLSRPAETRRGGGESKKAINDTVTDMVSSIFG